MRVLKAIDAHLNLFKTCSISDIQKSTNLSYSQVLQVLTVNSRLLKMKGKSIVSFLIPHEYVNKNEKWYRLVYSGEWAATDVTICLSTGEQYGTFSRWVGSPEVAEFQAKLKEIEKAGYIPENTRKLKTLEQMWKE